MERDVGQVRVFAAGATLTGPRDHEIVECIKKYVTEKSLARATEYTHTYLALLPSPWYFPIPLLHQMRCPLDAITQSDLSSHSLTHAPTFPCQPSHNLPSRNTPFSHRTNLSDPLVLFALPPRPLQKCPKTRKPPRVCK